MQPQRKPLFLLYHGYGEWSAERTFPYSLAETDPVDLRSTISRINENRFVAKRDAAGLVVWAAVTVLVTVASVVYIHNLPLRVASTACFAWLLVSIAGWRKAKSISKEMPTCVEADLLCIEPLCDLISQFYSKWPEAWDPNRWACGVLAALLPEISPCDSGYLTNHAKVVLNRYIDPANKRGEPGLTAAYLKALTITEDETAYNTVSHLASFTTDPVLAGLARSYLSAISAKRVINRQRDVLLRPSAANPKTQAQSLLRATGPTQIEVGAELLRPEAGSESRC